MQVGCGLRLRWINGGEYLYFWHYEREGARSARREDYIGAARHPSSRREAQRRILAYCRRAQADLAAKIARIERAM